METTDMESSSKESAVKNPSIVDTVFSNSAFQRKQPSFIVRFADPTLSPPPRPSLRPSTPRPKYSRLDNLDLPEWKSRLELCGHPEGLFKNDDETDSKVNECIFLSSNNPAQGSQTNSANENPAESTSIDQFVFTSAIDPRDTTISQENQGTKGQPLFPGYFSSSFSVQTKYNITPPTTPAGVPSSSSRVENRKREHPSKIPRYRHRIPRLNIVASKFSRPIRKPHSPPSTILTAKNQQGSIPGESNSFSTQLITNEQDESTQPSGFPTTPISKVESRMPDAPTWPSTVQVPKSPTDSFQSPCSLILNNRCRNIFGLRTRY